MKLIKHFISRRYAILSIVCLFYLWSCSTDNNSVDAIVIIDSRFLHVIPDCDNQGNPEINCTEFVRFRDENSVDILIGGSDIVGQAAYTRDGDLIVITEGETAIYNIRFKILSETQLEREDDKSIWEKE